MKTEVLYSLVIFIFISNISYTSSESKTRSLSRRKRYVVFPEGSSMTVAFCITMNLIEVPTMIFTELINFGINYDLPNSTLVFRHFDEPKETSRRRHRRELYNKMEIILNAMGLDGKTCIYRALCEAAQILEINGGNLLEEIIGRLFRFPLENLRNSESEHKTYHWAHRIGHEITSNCTEIFPNCHFSIIDMLLGYKTNN